MSAVTRTVLWIAGLSLAASSLEAADGLLVVEKSTTGGTTQTHQIQIEKNRMRAETTGAAGEQQAVVFDGTKQVLWIVNYNKKTYSEITKAEADRLGAQMSDVMGKMQQQLQGMPPEQRAQVEAMMRGRGAPGAGAIPKPQYKKTGTDKVGAWTCDTYEASVNAQKTAELCTVEPQALGFTASDFDVSRQLQAFFSKLMPQGGDTLFRLGSAQDQEFSGVPVRRRSFGARPSTSEISSVTRQSFSDATFAIPEGFQKDAAPFGRGRGR